MIRALGDCGKVRAIPVLDAKLHFALSSGERSPRHKVINNLPGTPSFCPLVRRTERLDALSTPRWDEQARTFLESVHPDLVARAAAFLLLSDSRSSFAIEAETVPASRVARWGQVLEQAGKAELSLAELERLQALAIGDARFVTLGLRDEGGFVGQHERSTGDPLPEHISARPRDLPELIEGMLAFERRATEHRLDPVVLAASLAFGFVYVHPFVDGNGRIHRFLVHHLLARTGYVTRAFVFPISAVMLRRIEDYRAVLESYSKPLLLHIDWERTPDGNVAVRNDTADFYRFFDATAHATFLYECIAETVEKDLPKEISYLEAFDRFATGVRELVEMPGGVFELLRSFLAQNQGKLSKRARTHKFARLTDEEVNAIEQLYAATLASVDA